jgi:Mycothiol maleylpyruvate isomerase N-terminal domain
VSPTTASASGRSRPRPRAAEHWPACDRPRPSPRRRGDPLPSRLPRTATLLPSSIHRGRQRAGEHRRSNEAVLTPHASGRARHPISHPSSRPTSRGHDLATGLETQEPRVLTCRRLPDSESAGTERLVPCLPRSTGLRHRRRGPWCRRRLRTGPAGPHLARAERADLLALLTELAPHQWDDPTLYTGWRVRDVVAHMISYEGLVRAGVAKLGHPDVVVPPGIDLPFANRLSSSRRPSPFAGRSKLS